MSFVSNNLSVLAYANNFTLWHYKTIDSAVTGTDYFGVASEMMRVGDLMIVNIDTDGTPSTKFYVVTAVSSGSVTVTLYS